jgi:ABC-type branched-subunit amino acid transport system ATPase component
MTHLIRNLTQRDELTVVLIEHNMPAGASSRCCPSGVP